MLVEIDIGEFCMRVLYEKLDWETCMRDLYETCMRVLIEKLVWDLYERLVWETCMRLVWDRYLRDLYETYMRLIWDLYETCMRLDWETWLRDLIESFVWERYCLLYYFIFPYTLPPFTRHTVPPKSSVERCHQVFIWSHLRIYCNILSKKWVTN